MVRVFSLLLVALQMASAAHGQPGDPVRLINNADVELWVETVPLTETACPGNVPVGKLTIAAGASADLQCPPVEGSRGYCVRLRRASEALPSWKEVACTFNGRVVQLNLVGR